MDWLFELTKCNPSWSSFVLCGCIQQHWPSYASSACCHSASAHIFWSVQLSQKAAATIGLKSCCTESYHKILIFRSLQDLFQKLRLIQYVSFQMKRLAIMEPAWWQLINGSQSGGSTQACPHCALAIRGHLQLKIELIALAIIPLSYL